MFVGIDLRGLAALRVLLGVQVAWDAWWSLFSFASAFLSDDGFVPRTLVLVHPPWFQSAFFWFGGLFGVRLLLLTLCFSSLCFAIGFRTRFFGWTMWLLLTSLHLRLPLIGHSGDALLRNLLFFANWMPLARVYSFDAGVQNFHRLQQESVHGEGSASKSKQRSLVPRSVVSAAQLAFLLQIACFLFFGGLGKVGSDRWSRECSAVSLLLELSPYTTLVGRIWSVLLPRWVGCAISRLSGLVEMLMAFLLFVPISHVRLAVAAMFGAGALIQGTCFRIDTLMWIPLYVSLTLMPSYVWSELHRLFVGKVSLVLHVNLDVWFSSRVLFVFYTFLLGDGATIKWTSAETSDPSMHWLTVTFRGQLRHDADALQVLLSNSCVPGLGFLSYVVGMMQSTVNGFGSLLDVFSSPNTFLKAPAQLPLPSAPPKEMQSLWAKVQKYGRTAIIVLCVLAMLSFNFSHSKVSSLMFLKKKCSNLSFSL